MKRYYLTQIFVLSAGAIVAWLAVYDDFARFYGKEGTIFKIENCTYPNPIVTSCFYGAIAFIIFLVWSVSILRKTEINLKIRQEKYLSWALVAGTIFGWGNFTKLYLDYMRGSQIGCSGAPMTSPFATPCFYGSSLFLLTLLVSWLILWKEKKVD